MAHPARHAAPALASEVRGAATEGLLRLAGGKDTAADGVFDGADVSAAGLGSSVHGKPWWDAALGGVRLAGCSLARSRLRRADLSGADLSGADLEGASCAGIVLDRARLEQAKLQGADLIGASLIDVDAGEAGFSQALLEDAVLRDARLRFADFTGAVMDGADLSGADLWGSTLRDVEAERARFKAARLDEAHCDGADLSGADLTGATLRRTSLKGARLRGAILRETVLDGADLWGADLSGAVLPHIVLSTCNLRHIRVAGAWLERTRLRASQLGGAIGEEEAGEYAAAREGYIVLEQNFRSLGLGEDASWAFRRRRRMGKRMHLADARASLTRRQPGAAAVAGLRWLGDLSAEWICDYGESVGRVLRSFVLVLVLFALVYWLAGCLELREGIAPGSRVRAVDYALFSLNSMTTVGTSEIGLRPAGQLGLLLSSVQSVVGTVLLGLFGFVLGARMRN